MTARWIVMVVAMCGALCTPASATDKNSCVENQDVGVTVTQQPVTPWISKTMPNSVREKLKRAYELSLTRVHEVPECAELFSGLGENATEALKSTLYYPADAYRERDICRGAPAYTFVGVSQTFVCRRFSSLQIEFAAVLLIHEALHHAGLTEYPMDRKARRPHEVNLMVVEACGF